MPRGYGYTLDAKLTKNAFPKVVKELRERAIARVNKSVYQAASIARQLCPVRTGFLKSTIVVVTYSRGELLRIKVLAPYAGWVERDQPFLRPAVESVKPRLFRDLKRLLPENF
jgi:hypothetical protein